MIGQTYDVKTIISAMKSFYHIGEFDIFQRDFPMLLQPASNSMYFFMDILCFRFRNLRKRCVHGMN